MPMLSSLSGWPPQGGAGPFDARKAAFASSPELVTVRSVDRIVNTRVDITCLFDKQVVTFRFFAATKDWPKMLPRFSGKTRVKTCAISACTTLRTADRTVNPNSQNAFGHPGILHPSLKSETWPPSFWRIECASRMTELRPEYLASESPTEQRARGCSSSRCFLGWDLHAAFRRARMSSM